MAKRLKRPKASTPEPLRERALRYLARREHSRTELENKLADGGAELSAVLDALEAEGLLSDRRAATAFANAKAHRYGPRYIRHYLQQHGIAADLIESTLAEAHIDTASAVEEAWRRKFGRMPDDAHERARQIRFLQARGFDLDAILGLMRRLEREAKSM